MNNKLFDNDPFLKPFGKNPRICSTGLERGCKPVLFTVEWTFFIQMLKERLFDATRAYMLLLVKCYDNKMVKLPGWSYLG